MAMVHVLLFLFVFGELNSASPEQNNSDANSLTVKICNETYSPTQELTIYDRVVVEEHRDLRKILDMNILHLAVHNITSYVRMASNGIHAAGPNYVETDIEILSIMFNLNSLCNQMLENLTKFEMTARRVTDRRYAAYEYLIDDQEGMAKKMISATELDVEEMIEVAVNLSNSALTMISKVVSTFENVKGIKRKQDIKLDYLQRERIKLLNATARQMEKVEEAKERRDEAESRAADYKRKEDEELQKMSSAREFIKELANYLSNSAGLGDVFRSTSEKIVKKFSEYHEKEKRVKEEETMIMNEEMVILTDLALRIADIDAVVGSEESIASAVVAALHHAIGALLNIYNVLDQVAEFWKTLRVVGNDIIERYQSHSDFESWKRPSNVKRYIRLSARCVALSLVCKELRDDMQIARRELKQCIQENPTYEQSRYFVRKHDNNLLITAASSSDKDKLPTFKTTSTDDNEILLLEAHEIGKKENGN